MLPSHVEPARLGEVLDVAVWAHHHGPGSTSRQVGGHLPDLGRYRPGSPGMWFLNRDSAQRSRANPFCTWQHGRTNERHRERLWGLGTEGCVSWHGTARWEPMAVDLVAGAGSELKTPMWMLPGDSSCAQGTERHALQYLCALLRGCVTPNSSPTRYYAAMCRSCSTCPEPEASGQTPSLAFRLPQRLQITAEPYERAGSAFLHNCRAIAWWRVCLVCPVRPSGPGSSRWW